MRRARALMRLSLLSLGMLASSSQAKASDSTGTAKPAAPAAPQFAPFSEFTVLSPGGLKSLRFKLTRLGGADPANAVAAWSVNGQVANPAEFIPYRRAGFQYEPPNSMPYIFGVEIRELRAAVDSAGTLSQVVHGAAESRGVISFAMLATEGGQTRAFEAILGAEGAGLLMVRLLGALHHNPSASSALRRFACAGDLLPEDAPRAADSLVKITLSALKADKASPGEFMASAVIANVSPGPIAGPLTLVIHVDGDTHVIGGEGETCRVLPAGAPFVSLGDAPLAPGEAIRQTLKFWNQTGQRFEVTLHLVAGAGTR